MFQCSQKYLSKLRFLLIPNELLGWFMCLYVNREVCWFYSVVFFIVKSCTVIQYDNIMALLHSVGP